MPVTLDWLGCATFRLTIDDLVLFLDAYIDRVPSAPPVGLTAAEVQTADYVLIGHSHFDHIAGAEVITANTGARVIGSNESIHVLGQAGVPDAQLIRSQGGERHRLSPDPRSSLAADSGWRTISITLRRSRNISGRSAARR